MQHYATPDRDIVHRRQKAGSRSAVGTAARIVTVALDRYPAPGRREHYRYRERRISEGAASTDRCHTRAGRSPDASPDDLAHAVSAGTNDVAGRTRCLHPCRTCREADRQEISIAALLFPWLMPLRKRSAHRWPGGLPHTPLRAPGPATTSMACHCSALKRGNVIASSLAKAPPKALGKGLRVFRICKQNTTKSLSSRRREYVGGVADRTPAAQNITSRFTGSRTFSAGSADGRSPRCAPLCRRVG
jgi:hypothetical protein